MSRNAVYLAMVSGILFAISVEAGNYRTAIIFNNRNITMPDGSVKHEPIKMPDGSGLGEKFRAQLRHVKEDGTTEAIGPIASFRASPDEGRYYLVEAIQQVVLENWYFPDDDMYNSVIRLRLRVWEAPLWEMAQFRGESADFDYVLHPLLPDPLLVPESAINFVGFTLTERPKLRALAVSGGGLVTLSVETVFGLKATQARVEKSSDLLIWEEVGMLLIQDGVITLPEAENRAQAVMLKRYYRVQFD